MQGKRCGFAGLTLGACLLAAVPMASGQKKPYYGWFAPIEYIRLKNPYPSSDEVLKQGKTIYQRYCQQCHGPKGDGRGSSALSLRTPPGDLRNKELMGSYTDGSLFWKIRVGKGEMPPWQIVLKDTDIWKVVRYIRGFSK